MGNYGGFHLVNSNKPEGPITTSCCNASQYRFCQEVKMTLAVPMVTEYKWKQLYLLKKTAMRGCKRTIWAHEDRNMEARLTLLYCETNMCFLTIFLRAIFGERGRQRGMMCGQRARGRNRTQAGRLARNRAMCDALTTAPPAPTTNINTLMLYDCPIKMNRNKLSVGRTSVCWALIPVQSNCKKKKITHFE